MPGKHKNSGSNNHDPFPFWSGTLTFGLVSVPVDLYPAVRTHRVSMKMLSPSGRPLKRQYFCSADDKALASKEIVRGYEQDDGSFIVVTDEELEALAPRKSRDIDLRVFVERASIPVRLLQRPYVLAPGGESTRAYHLLVETMERTALAGIATFVMRGKEYLAAIVADDGLLRAATLHFNDEIRTAEEVGLPDVEAAPAKLRKEAQAALKKLTAKAFDTDLLHDEEAERLRALAEEKYEAGRDVVEVSEEVDAAEADEESDDVVDIMSLLRRRMQEGSSGKQRESKKSAAGDLEARSRDELYEQAQILELPGRSKMSREELIDAIRDAS